MPGGGPKGRPWRRLRSAILAQSDVCWTCGHAGADAVDHVIARARGGAMLDPANLRPIHGRHCPTCGVACNSVKGKRSHITSEQLNCSREW